MTEKTWRTSSYTGNANSCVELAVGKYSAGIRDTKDRDGGILSFSVREFGSFLVAVKAGFGDAEA